MLITPRTTTSSIRLGIVFVSVRVTRLIGRTAGSREVSAGQSVFFSAVCGPAQRKIHLDGSRQFSVLSGLKGFSAGFSCTRSRNVPFIPLARKMAESPYLSRRRSEADRARAQDRK